MKLLTCPECGATFLVEGNASRAVWAAHRLAHRKLRGSRWEPVEERWIREGGR